MVVWFSSIDKLTSARYRSGVSKSQEEERAMSASPCAKVGKAFAEDADGLFSCRPLTKKQARKQQENSLMTSKLTMVEAALDEVRRLDEADDVSFNTADVDVDFAVSEWLSSSIILNDLRGVLEGIGTFPESAIPQTREVVRLLLKSPLFLAV
jgi:hypothetical protein